MTFRKRYDGGNWKMNTRPWRRSLVVRSSGSRPRGQGRRAPVDFPFVSTPLPTALRSVQRSSTVDRLQIRFRLRRTGHWR